MIQKEKSGKFWLSRNKNYLRAWENLEKNISMNALLRNKELSYLINKNLTASLLHNLYYDNNSRNKRKFTKPRATRKNISIY